MSEPGEEEMMSLREVCRFFGGAAEPLDKATIYRWIASGKLPAPIKLGNFTSRWRRSDCQKTLAAIIEAQVPAIKTSENA